MKTYKFNIALFIIYYLIYLIILLFEQMIDPRPYTY